MKLHERKNPHYISDYIKAGIWPLLGLAVYIAYRVNGKAVIDALLIGGTVMLLPWVIARVATDFNNGCKTASKR